MQTGLLRFVDNEGQAVTTVPGVKRTVTSAERIKGLLGQPELDSDQGLWIIPCRAVHTFGMKYSLDIIYLNKFNLVVRVTEQLHPNRISACWNARSTLELIAGSVQRLHLTCGLIAHWIDYA